MAVFLCNSMFNTMITFSNGQSKKPKFYNLISDLFEKSENFLREKLHV
jgi:hypothetical protein